MEYVTDEEQLAFQSIEAQEEELDEISEPDSSSTSSSLEEEVHGGMAEISHHLEGTKRMTPVPPFSHQHGALWQCAVQ